MEAGGLGISTWAEPGGDEDPSNPRLPLPAGVEVISAGGWGARGGCSAGQPGGYFCEGALAGCVTAFWKNMRGSPEPIVGEARRLSGTGRLQGGNDVSKEEIQWMAQQRELVLSEPQLVRDYGAEAEIMLEAIAGAGMPTAVAGALAWPGVGTRWRRFILWWQQLPDTERPSDSYGALAGFARAVGRVRTFRALALDATGLKRIFEEDEIFPSGRLRPGVDAAYLRNVVETHGVSKVAVVRLFISHMPKIGGVDPSVSLHDDWQTTSLIASGYASPGKRVHLFELSVPAVESLGWTLQEVSGRSGPFLGPRYTEHARWFRFPSPGEPRGTWFDANLQRTERYGLYSVPHLRKRLLRLCVFRSLEELRTVVAPFVAAMQARQEHEPN